MPNLKVMLQNVNLKVTEPRLAILKVLMTTSNELTVIEIFKYTKHLSFGTVYSTLGCFEKAGLVRKFKVGNEQARYSFKDGKDNNIRLHCCHCDSIQPFKQESVQEKVFEAIYSVGIDTFDLILHQQGCGQCKNILGEY